MTSLYVGIDLAWGYRARTGIAAVDEAGRLLAVGSLLTDQEISGWVDALPAPPRVVAIDAPLVVTNDHGQRDCERQIARAYGRFGASCHTSNRARMPSPRGAVLAAGRWSIDAGSPSDGPVCIEVYPHAALVGLFALPYRLLYKKGPVPVRRTGFAELVQRLESWPVLSLDASPSWAALRQAVGSAVRQVDLHRVEDQLDAVLCAGLALLWSRGGDALVVYGNPAADHIVAPPRPLHSAARPGKRA